MTRKQKENIARILINIGSIVFAGVVLGYFISDDKITSAGFSTGIISVIICYFIAIIIDK